MPQMKDQSHGWTKSPGGCFFKHWISDVFFDSLLTFLWHLHCCHLISLIHRIQWFKMGDKQLLNHKKPSSGRVLPFYPIQSNMSTKPITNLGLPSGYFPSPGIWQRAAQHPGSLTPKAANGPTREASVHLVSSQIQTESDIGKTFGEAIFHEKCSPPPTRGHGDQQLLRIRTQVWGLPSSSYLHTFPL